MEWGEKNDKDFFDFAFLLSLVAKSDYNYLKFKMNLSNEKQVKDRIFEKCNSFSMEGMAKDVQPFLFNPNDVKKILLFLELIHQTKL